MSQLTILWSAVAASCITLALVHGMVWWRQRSSLANLMFALLALGTAAMAGLELCMMKASSPGSYTILLRWYQLAVWVAFCAIVGFVHFYLRPSQRAAALVGLLAVGVRSIVLVVNFIGPGNQNYREISSLRQLAFLGETVVSPVGIPNPWMVAAQFSLLLLLVFVGLATRSARRRGDRKSALWVGAGTMVFVLAGTVQAVLVFWGLLEMPMTASLFFTGCVVAMSHELSQELLASRRTAVELRESQEQVQLAADSASVGFWSLDKTTGRGWMPPSTRTMLGLDQDEVLDVSAFLLVIHPDDRDKVRSVIQAALQTVQQTRTEFRVVRPDGGVRRFVSLGRSLVNEQGVIVGRTGVLIDITGQRLAEDALHKEQILTHAVFDSVPGLLYLYDREGRMVRWNKQHETLTGYCDTELRNMTAADWFEGDDLLRVRAEWEKVFSEGQTTVELPLKMKDGRKVPYLLTGVRLEIEGVPHLVGIGIDVSERRRIENEVVKQREEMAHLSRVASLGELSGALAHELNQPLCSILSNAQAAQRLLARDVRDDDALQEILADIVSEDRRAGEVIVRLRALLKRGETHLQPLDLHACMEEVMKLMHSELVARGVTVVRECPATVPPVMADHVQLQQVFINLIANACDAMDAVPAGRRVLTLRCQLEEEHLHVEVQDTGSGFQMPVEELFEPFHTTKSKGLGMGLAICRTIVEAHNGRLKAEACPEGGAVFHLHLPVSTSA